MRKKEGHLSYLAGMSDVEGELYNAERTVESTFPRPRAGEMDDIEYIRGQIFAIICSLRVLQKKVEAQSNPSASRH
jgi:hypothetical protein